MDWTVHQKQMRTRMRMKTKGRQTLVAVDVVACVGGIVVAVGARVRERFARHDRNTERRVVAVGVVEAADGCVSGQCEGGEVGDVVVAVVVVVVVVARVAAGMHTCTRPVCVHVVRVAVAIVAVAVEAVVEIMTTSGCDACVVVAVVVVAHAFVVVVVVAVVAECEDDKVDVG
jgi:hypothetical protein